MILSVHITHKSADMSCLELIGRNDPRTLLSSLRAVEGVRECVVIRTCNRVEMYTVTCDPLATREGLERLVRGFIPFDVGSNLVQFLSQKESVLHLFRVSSGLESLIVGEDQIQGQVRDAFMLAQDERCIGPKLNLVFQKAIGVGKRVRSETRLNQGAVSVGSAAVELAESILGDLDGKNILVVGAGEMATLIAKHLLHRTPDTVFFSNRTYARAVELAFQLGGRAVRLNCLSDFLPETDLVLVATSSNHILLDRADVEEAVARRTKASKLVIVDVSFPRNVSPEVTEVEGVELHDIEGLKEVAQRNIMRRKLEIAEAERIITAELDLLDRRFEEMKATQILSSLYLKFNCIKDQEMRRAMNRLREDNVEEVLEDFANSLTSKFLAEPTEIIKQASREDNSKILEVAREMFRLEG
jgi:glutamyl-tRNA reductase